MLKEKFGFIGGGKMAEALSKGIINSKLNTPDNIMISDVIPERLKLLTKEFGVKTTQNNKDAATQAAAVSVASAGLMTSKFGITRRDGRCSMGWWVGPSSPTKILSWVNT